MFYQTHSAMKALQNILVPVDFTPHADNALRYAVALARHLSGSKLFILHAYHLPAAVTGASAMALAPYYEDELRETTDLKFAELEQRLLQQCPVPYQFIREYGPAVPDICEMAEKHGVDLIVMPAHPTSALEEYIGNVTTATIRNSEVPVLVVPPTCSFALPDIIVFATDCKDIPQEKATEQLKPWLMQFQPRLHLLHTGKNSYYMPEEKALKLLAIESLFSSFTPVLKVEESEDPEDGIIRYVKEKQATLLAVLPRKHGPLYHLLNKSVTHRLAFHTPVPMLVLKES